MNEESSLAASRKSGDWIKANQEQIKCLSMVGADAAFSVYMATVNFAPNEPTWWLATYRALEATAALWGCLVPDEAYFEEKFSGDNLKCQCAQVAGQLFVEFNDASGSRVREAQSDPGVAKNIESTGSSDGYLSCQWTTTNGLLVIAQIPATGRSRPIWFIVPNEGTTCCVSSPTIPPTQPYPLPYELGDYEGGCGAKVELIDSCIDKFGLVQNFYQVDERNYSCDGNDSNYFYWESVRGPYMYPYNGLYDAFPGIVSRPMYAPPHPDADPCPCSSSSSPNDKPVLEGDWVSLRFDSQEKSPFGERPIRKQLRYRSKSTEGLGAITQHWTGFTWTSGPVIVQHADAWWGTPQVWAASEDEGKRVIRHAGREAGIDPDQTGRWVVSRSDHPRYGVSLPVKMAYLDGGPWVTQRLTPSGPSEIARPIPDADP